MPDDPYQPPAADLGGARELHAPGELSVGLAFREAWDATWSQFGTWLLASTVGALVGLAAALTVIGLFLVLPVLAWGSFYFYLRMLDGEAEFADLFAGFRRYGEVLGPTLGAAILMFGLGLLGQSVQLLGMLVDQPGIEMLGMVLYWVYYVVVLLPLTLAYYLIVEREMGALEALRGAWALASGRRLKLIGVILLSGVVVLCGVLLLIVGVIPAAAIAGLMWTSAYRQLAGRPA